VIRKNKRTKNYFLATSNYYFFVHISLKVPVGIRRFGGLRRGLKEEEKTVKYI